MEREPRTERGRAIHRRRGVSVEPVFGQTRERRRRVTRSWVKSIKRHPELDSSDTQNWTPDYVVPTSGSASVFRLSSPDRLFSRRR